MPRYRLSRRAEADFEEIAVYTIENWGPDQAERYAGDLENTFQLLGDNPQIGRGCENIRPGLRRMDGGSHVIFYRTDEDSDIGLIQPPAWVGAFQMWPTTFVQFRAVHLNPPPDATGRNCQSPLGGHFGQVRRGNRIPKIPSHAPQDMSP